MAVRQTVVTMALAIRREIKLAKDRDMMRDLGRKIKLFGAIWFRINPVNRLRNYPEQTPNHGEVPGFKDCGWIVTGKGALIPNLRRESVAPNKFSRSEA
jgi:hypothetical protein